jgi:hypothetical protein
MLDQKLIFIGLLIGTIALVSGAKDLLKNMDNKRSPYFIFSVGQIGIGVMLFVTLLFAYFQKW